MKIYEWLAILTSLKCPNCKRIVPEGTTTCPFCKSDIAQYFSDKPNPETSAGAREIIIFILFSLICTVLSISIIFTGLRAQKTFTSIFFSFLLIFLLFNILVFGIHELFKLFSKKARLVRLPLLISAILFSLLFLYLYIIPNLLSRFLILTFFYITSFFGLFTLVFSLVELVNIIRRKSSALILPFVISAFLLSLFVSFLFIMHPFRSQGSTRSKVSRVKGEQNMLATALEAYFIDNNCYPSPGRVSFHKSEYYHGDGSYAKEGGIVPIALTTPVAYATYLPHDPFHSNGRGYYGYGGGPGLTGAGGKPTIDDNNHDYSGIWPAVGWIVTSYGPDVVDGNIWMGSGQPLREELAWSDSYSMDSPDFMQCDEKHPLVTSGFTYDPTNGTSSPGDVWRRGP
jgi:RNA polymerase subunit RPABC4/transcription elongation factor Spt4